VIELATYILTIWQGVCPLSFISMISMLEEDEKLKYNINYAYTSQIHISILNSNCHLWLYKIVLYRSPPLFYFLHNKYLLSTHVTFVYFHSCKYKLFLLTWYNKKYYHCSISLQLYYLVRLLCQVSSLSHIFYLNSTWS